MNAADRLTRFILEKSENEPLSKRVELYSDAAEVLADEKHAKALGAMAARLKEVETQTHQLLIELGEGHGN